jgi:hypothetical protein
MAENRKPRELEDRLMVERPKQWQQPDLLPEPDKQPGYDYRWIRVATLNAPDPRNISGKLREGYEPVALEEQPKFKLLADPASRFKDNIEIGGLLLCKIPIDFVEQRNAFFAKQSQAQMEAVDNTYMRQSNPKMPLFKENRSSTSFGSGI